MKPLISFIDVRKSYGEHVILDGITLEIAEGETVALIGPSGGGKSTLLRCLNGLTTFEAGEVRVGPHTLHAVASGNHRAAEVQPLRRMLGMVFQDFQLFPHLTALENVIEAPLQVLRIARSQAQRRGSELLARVGLAHRENNYPRQLSGGQKQRVAIARALAMQPKVLLCDEITSALDPELKHEVLEVLEDLKREGMTLILVTHEIGFARKAADRVCVLAQGRIIEEGPPEEVIGAPKSPRTQQFLARVLG
jgi:polar amino acid transport system ATP-binding protein